MQYQDLIPGKKYIINNSKGIHHYYTQGTIVEFRGDVRATDSYGREYTRFYYVEGVFLGSEKMEHQNLMLSMVDEYSDSRSISITLDEATKLYTSTANETVRTLLLKSFSKEELEGKVYPKTWYDLQIVDGFYVSTMSNISSLRSERAVDGNAGTFTTAELAKASRAMARLSQCHKRYREIEGGELEHYAPAIGLSIDGNVLSVVKKHPRSNAWQHFSFRTEKTRDEFFDNFKDLLEEAIPLLR